MFKYVKFSKKKKDNTVLEFRGGNDNINIIALSDVVDGVSVVALKSDNEESINRLISDQPAEIRCKEISKDEFKILVANSAQVKRVYERVAKKYNKDMDIIAKKYPARERETWGIQVEQAKKYLETGEDSDAIFIKILAENSGESIEDFAKGILEKDKEYQIIAAQKLAEKRKLQKELMGELGL